MILRIFWKFSGSFSRTHKIFGAVNPANAMFAVYSVSFPLPIVLFKYSHSFVVLPSFQRIAGRITLSFSSKITSPCICPPKLIPATSSFFMPTVSSRIPVTDCSYQSYGFCSDQPGFGNEIGYSFETVFTTVPCLSISRSFTEEVPKSTPI